MKLFRYGEPGAEKPGMVDANGTPRDLSGVIADLAGAALSPEGLARLRDVDAASLPEVSGSPRFGPCVADVRRFFCIGLNYSDHAAETGAEVPKEPIVFMKVCAVTGPNDDVVIPKDSTETDWEVELGVVIGRRTQHVTEAEALDYVAGYCVINDVSERDFQIRRGGQWVKGKSCDTFGPIGPYLVTADEVAEPQNLKMFLEVNGHRYQDGSTQTMVFGVKHLVSHLSRFITLMPGDVISTGTPPGVGMGQKPRVYLKPGDSMYLGIEGLGEQRQNVVAFSG